MNGRTLSTTLAAFLLLAGVNVPVYSQQAAATRAVDKVSTEYFDESWSQEQQIKYVEEQKEKAKEQGLVDEEPLEEEIAHEITNKLVAAVAMGTPLPIRLSVDASETVTPSGDAEWYQLFENGPFDETNLVRVQIELLEPGFIYLITTDSEGAAALLHPALTGHPLSRGNHAQIPAGLFSFPKDLIGMDGLRYAASEFNGTETFMIIASKVEIPDLPTLLGEFADICNERVNTRKMEAIKTRSAGLGFTQTRTRIPIAFGDAQQQEVEEVAAPEPLLDGPVIQSENGATFIVYNLNKLASAAP